MKDQEIIDNYKNADLSELKRLVSEIEKITTRNQNHLINELKLRKELNLENLALEKVKESKAKLIVKASKRLESKEQSDLKFKSNLLLGALLLICTGPFLDYFLHFSMFSRDPAPAQARIISNIAFFIIYSSSTYLVIKKKYWARWISFSLYILFFIVSLLMLTSARTITLFSIFEIVIRITILITILKSTSWLKTYRLI